MKKIIPILITAGLLTINITKSYSQDFFNGFPGPRDIIINYFGTFSKEGKYSQTLVPAFFAKNYNKKMPNIQIGAIINYDEKNVNSNLLLGYITTKDNMSNRASTVIGVNNVNLQDNLTTIINNIVLDLEVGANFNKESIIPRGSVTIGYGLQQLLNIKNFNLRAGGYAGFEGKQPTYGGIISLEKKGKGNDLPWWIQSYAKGKGKDISYEIRVVKNINIRKKQKK